MNDLVCKIRKHLEKTAFILHNFDVPHFFHKFNFDKDDAENDFEV